MLRFFRQIRQRLLTENRFSKYLLYAIGEILLVVIGILIALYLDDISREREKQIAFDTALSQIYTNLQIEKGRYQYFMAAYENQSRIAREYLEGEYLVPQGQEPRIARYMNSLALGDVNLGDEAILSTLHDNITSLEETVLVNKISSHYLIWKDWDEVINVYKIRFLDDLYEKYQSPFIENYVLFGEWQFGGSRKFRQLEIDKARQILSDDYFKTAVLSVLNRNKDLLGRYDWKVRSIESIIENIREHNPLIRLTFEELGIHFIASDDGHTEFIPMELNDPVKAIWNVQLPLQDGDIDFINGNSALASWGATLEMNGKLLYSGKQIPVSKGIYDIEINLTDLTYSITPIMDTKEN